jgi:hypothetical protein
MQAALQQAATKFKVLGLSLKPYTLGHDLLLYTLDSGFCRDVNHVPTFEDLLISVWVCAQDDADSAIRRMSRRSTKIWFTLWGLYCGKFDVSEAFFTFQKYILANTQAPEFWICKSGDGSQTGIPFAQLLKLQMVKLGMSEKDAINTRFVDAHLNLLTTLDASGVIKLFSESDKAAIAALNNPESRSRLKQWAERVSRN